MTNTVVRLEAVQYGWPGQPYLLNIPQFQINSGEKIFIQGKSGSGKSTLLNLIAGVLTCSSGEISIAGHSLTNCSHFEKDKLRADHIGFIFQVFNLLPYLSVVENVLLPCHFSSRRKQSALDNFSSLEEAAISLLTSLEIPNSILKRPVTELSVGQQQRVAVARALLGSPELIIADEPSSALDWDTQLNFMDVLMSHVERSGSSLLFVSHDQRLASKFDRQISISEFKG